jgi:hypothetical protein
VTRKTRADYPHPGSFSRVLEAAIACADADSEDDVEYERARKRLTEAALAYATAENQGDHVRQFQRKVHRQK